MDNTTEAQRQCRASSFPKDGAKQDGQEAVSGPLGWRDSPHFPPDIPNPESPVHRPGRATKTRPSTSQPAAGQSRPGGFLHLRDPGRSPTTAGTNEMRGRRTAGQTGLREENGPKCTCPLLPEAQTFGIPQGRIIRLYPDPARHDGQEEVSGRTPIAGPADSEARTGRTNREKIRGSTPTGPPPQPATPRRTPHPDAPEK